MDTEITYDMSYEIHLAYEYYNMATQSSVV